MIHKKRLYIVRLIFSHLHRIRWWLSAVKYLENALTNDSGLYRKVSGELHKLSEISCENYFEQ